MAELIMHTFDEQSLVLALEAVNPVLRVAFAAACAQRQLPAYRTFAASRQVESPTAIERALDDAWENPAKHGPELDQQLAECMSLIPQQGTVAPWTKVANYAQDACISVAYVLRARLTGSAQAAAWSGRHAWECLYQFVIDTESLDINIPTELARVLEHPLLQKECERQSRDAQALLGAPKENWQSIVHRLRQQATMESQTFFTP